MLPFFCTVHMYYRVQNIADDMRKVHIIYYIQYNIKIELIRDHAQFSTSCYMKKRNGAGGCVAMEQREKFELRGRMIEEMNDKL